MKALNSIRFPHSVFETGCGVAASFEKVGSKEAASWVGVRAAVGAQAEEHRASHELTRGSFHMWKNQSHEWKKEDVPLSVRCEHKSTDPLAPVVSEEDILAEARKLVAFLAHSEQPGESVASCLRRASHLSGLPISRINRIHYDKPRTLVSARELTQLKQRAAVERARRIQRYEAELDRLKRLEGLGQTEPA